MLRYSIYTLVEFRYFFTLGWVGQEFLTESRVRTGLWSDISRSIPHEARPADRFFHRLRRHDLWSKAWRLWLILLTSLSSWLSQIFCIFLTFCCFCFMNLTISLRHDFIAFRIFFVMMLLPHDLFHQAWLHWAGLGVSSYRYWAGMVFWTILAGSRPLPRTNLTTND